MVPGLLSFPYGEATWVGILSHLSLSILITLCPRELLLGWALS